MAAPVAASQYKVFDAMAQSKRELARPDFSAHAGRLSPLSQTVAASQYREQDQYDWHLAHGVGYVPHNERPLDEKLGQGSPIATIAYRVKGALSNLVAPDGTPIATSQAGPGPRSRSSPQAKAQKGSLCQSDSDCPCNQPVSGSGCGCGDGTSDCFQCVNGDACICYPGACCCDQGFCAIGGTHTPCGGGGGGNSSKKGGGGGGKHGGRSGRGRGRGGGRGGGGLGGGSLYGPSSLGGFQPLPNVPVGSTGATGGTTSASPIFLVVIIGGLGVGGYLLYHRLHMAQHQESELSKGKSPDAAA